MTAMSPVTEHDLRTAVHRQVTTPCTGKELIVDEFVVSERGRIDVAVIGERLFGYELKSDLDTLYRLPRQMNVFGAVFDFCTLVVTPKHLKKAREVLKRGWGLAVVERNENETLNYNQVRKAYQRKTRNNFPLASLLWRDELLAALDALNLSQGYRQRTRDELAHYLAANVERDELRSIVSETLTARRGWRVDRELRGNAVTYQSEGASSRFLARRFLKQPVGFSSQRG